MTSTTTNGDILTVEGIGKRFGGLTALEQLTFNIRDESITGIIGPNGAGKSTLFNVITGIHQPDRGNVYLRDNNITGKSPPKIAAMGIGRTFQRPRIFGGMTVRENLHFSPKNQTGETIVGAMLYGSTVAREEDEIQTKANEILELLDINHLADNYSQELSGGQQKLLELGRVLMTEPDIILLDEPAEGVNPSLQETLFDRLHKLNEGGKTIVMIEHDMDVIMENCEEIIVLHNGQTLAMGSPSEIQQNENVIDAYLGGVET